MEQNKTDRNPLLEIGACKAGYISFNELNKKFGEDIFKCNGCPNFIYRDGMSSCKLLGGI